MQQHSGMVGRQIHESSSRRRSVHQVVSISARKVRGSFRLGVTVKVGEEILPRAVRNLATLRYIKEAIPLNDQWHPVFARYIGQLEDKVKGLGADPDLIAPSADDPGCPGISSQEKGKCYTGKICEVLFSCFGDFEGFVLCSCSEKHQFRTTEKAIGELALRACKDRLRVTVCVTETKPDKIRKIIVHC